MGFSTHVDALDEKDTWTVAWNLCCFQCRYFNRIDDKAQILFRKLNNPVFSGFLVAFMHYAEI